MTLLPNRNYQCLYLHQIPFVNMRTEIEKILIAIAHPLHKLIIPVHDQSQQAAWLVELQKPERVYGSFDSGAFQPQERYHCTPFSWKAEVGAPAHIMQQ